METEYDLSTNPSLSRKDLKRYGLKPGKNWNSNILPQYLDEDGNPIKKAKYYSWIYRIKENQSKGEKIYVEKLQKNISKIEEAKADKDFKIIKSFSEFYNITWEEAEQKFKNQESNDYKRKRRYLKQLKEHKKRQFNKENKKEILNKLRNKAKFIAGNKG